MVETSTTVIRRRLGNLILFGLLAWTLYVVYFRGFTRMGLYEDDWSAIAPYANGDWSVTWEKVWLWLTHWPNGRPLGQGTCAIAAWALFHLGGMAALYLLPFAIVLACAWTIHQILRQSIGTSAAFIGALTFTLLPTDTLRVSLHAAPHLYLAALCMLQAIVAFQNRKNWTAMQLTFLGMLFHETSTLSIFLGPLLFFSWDREFFRRTLHFWASTAAGLLAVLFCRVFIFAEVRANSTFSSLSQVFERSLVSLRTGLSTHFTLILERCRGGLQFERPGSAAAFVAVLVAVVLAAGWNWRTLSFTRAAIRPAAAAAGLALLFGLLATAAPYPCYFTDPYWPANHVAGRLASVHSASGVGFAFCAAGCFRFIELIPWTSLRALAAAALVLPLALLFSWGNTVRMQYLEAWRNQQYFWSALLDQMGNIKPNDIAFVEWESAHTPPFTWVIASNSWADSIVLRNIYYFPEDELRESRLFRIVGPWQQYVHTASGKVYWDMPTGDWLAETIELKPSSLMVFRMKDGRPIPERGPVQINDVTLPLIQPTSGKRPGYPTKPLFRALICPHESSR